MNYDLKFQEIRKTGFDIETILPSFNSLYLYINDFSFVYVDLLLPILYNTCVRKKLYFQLVITLIK